MNFEYLIEDILGYFFFYILPAILIGIDIYSDYKINKNRNSLVDNFLCDEKNE